MKKFNQLMKLELQIARRYLFSKKRDGFISLVTRFSLAGIILGVAALIIVMSVMNGYRTDLMNLMLGFNGHITIYTPDNNGIKNSDLIRKKLNAIPEIADIFPIIERQVIISNKNIAIGSIVRGIEFKDLQNKALIINNIVKGKINNCRSNDSILIGENMALELKLRLMDKIRMISPGGVQTIAGQIPRSKDYRVCAIFKTGMYLYDSSNVFIPLSIAQTQFQLNNQVSKIELNIRDLDKTREVSDIIQSLFPEFYISNWKYENSSLLQALEVEKIVMFLILTLIIFVAAFNIISSMVMMVNDKNKDIAIFTAMGMEKKSIITIFLFCGMIIGVIGTIIGVITGIILSLNLNNIKYILEKIVGNKIFDPVIYYLTQLPCELHFSDIFKISLMSLILCLLASIYPAWRAAKIDPAIILKKIG